MRSGRMWSLTNSREYPFWPVMVRLITSDRQLITLSLVDVEAAVEWRPHLAGEFRQASGRERSQHLARGTRSLAISAKPGRECPGTDLPADSPSRF